MLLIIESASCQWTRPEHSPAPRWTRPEQEEEEAEQEEEENSNPESSGLPRPAGGDSFQRILAVLGSAAHRQAEARPDGRVARTQSGVLQLAGTSPQEEAGGEAVERGGGEDHQDPC